MCQRTSDNLRALMEVSNAFKVCPLLVLHSSFPSTYAGMAIRISGYSDIVQGIQMFTGALTQLHVFGSSSEDLFVNRYIDALQEGLVLTVSKPVTALLPSNTRKFVGVFGIDIPGKDFEISVNPALVSVLLSLPSSLLHPSLSLFLTVLYVFQSHS